MGQRPAVLAAASRIISSRTTAVSIAEAVCRVFCAAGRPFFTILGFWIRSGTIDDKIQLKVHRIYISGRAKQPSAPSLSCADTATARRRESEADDLLR